jgi:excisionase family DNA binding protein
MFEYPSPTASMVGASVRPLLTVARAAFLASVSEATIRRAIREGRLPRVQVGRAVRICPADFEVFVTSSNRTTG